MTLYVWLLLSCSLFVLYHSNLHLQLCIYSEHHIHFYVLFIYLVTFNVNLHYSCTSAKTFDHSISTISLKKQNNKLQLLVFHRNQKNICPRNNPIFENLNHWLVKMWTLLPKIEGWEDAKTELSEILLRKYTIFKF